MTWRIPICAALCLAVLSCGKSSSAEPEENNTQVAAELRPLFYFSWSDPSVTSGSFGGHAFLLANGSQKLALTAYHVAGPAPSPAPTGVTRWLANPLDGTSIRLGARLVIDNAQTISQNSSQRDVAAFHALDWDASRAFQLAATMPAVGETVYVLAVHQVDPFNPDPRGGPRRHPARVAVSHDSAFVYVYTASANSNGSSGAAVLNAAGEVVGINVGSIVSTANTWANFRNRYGACCDGLVGGEVGGMAVNVKSLRRYFGVENLQ